MQDNAANRILFVAGNSRSGTTMVSRILSNHPDVFAFHELHFFDEITAGIPASSREGAETTREWFARLCEHQATGYFGATGTSGPCRDAADKHIKPDERLTPPEVFARYLFYETRNHQKRIPCEQTPQNVFVAPHLIEALPGSRWILMVRDPRDVMLSQKNKWKRRRFSGGTIPRRESLRARINYHPFMIPKIWCHVMEQVERLRSNPAVLIVRFEDLLADPEPVVRKICMHAGIPYHPSLADVPIMGSSQAQDLNAARGIDFSKTGQWLQGGLNATEIGLCESFTAPHFEKWGYKPSGKCSNPFVLCWYGLTLPFQMVAAMLLNRKRLVHWFHRLAG